MQWFFDHLLAPIIVGLILFFVGLFVGNRREKKEKEDQYIKDLKNENAQLKEKIKQYENWKETEKTLDMTSQAGFYTQRLESGKTRRICSKCWDDEKKPINIVLDSRKVYFRCPNCNSGGLYDQDAVDKMNKTIDEYNEQVDNFIKF